MDIRTIRLYGARACTVNPEQSLSILDAAWSLYLSRNRRIIKIVNDMIRAVVSPTCDSIAIDLFSLFT